MRKVKLFYSLTFIFLLITNIGIAQNPLSLSWDGEPIEETMLVVGNVNDGEIIAYLIVTNNTSQSMDVKVRRERISMIEGTSSQFCWGESCYPPFVEESTEFLTIGPGESTLEEEFSGHYLPSGHYGDSFIEYEFFNVNNENENVKVIVQFAATITDIKTNDEDIVKVFPNPVVNILNIQANNVRQIELYDLTGKLVLDVINENPMNSLNTINCENFKPGMYFLIIRSNTNVNCSKVLIN